MTLTGVDEQTIISMSFPGGKMAQAVSAINTPLKNISVIYGTRGYIEMPEYWQGRKVLLKSQLKEDLFEDTRDSWGYDFEVREVNRLLQDGASESPVVSYSKSLGLMEILDEVRERIGLMYPFE